MRALILVLLLGTSLAAQDQKLATVAEASKVGAQEKAAPTLSEAQQLKKALFLARMETATLKAQLTDQRQRVVALETVFRLQVEQAFQKDSQQLSESCKALEIEFRETLKVDKTKTFDCQTLEFK